MKDANASESLELNEKIKELVIERIRATMSPNLKLSIGADGGLTKQEMIECVKKGDEVGKQIIKVHLNFLKAQATGKLISALNTV